MVTLVWDFDDTLAYREGRWTRTLFDVLTQKGYNHILEEHIRPYLQKDFPWHRHAEAHIDYFNGATWWSYLNNILLKPLLAYGIDEHEAKLIVAAFKDAYLDIKQWHLFDDTLSNLKESIGRGYTNFILSNHVPELEVLVKGLGLDLYFKGVISSGIVGYDKPNPMIFRELLKQVDKQSTIYMIGDSYTADIEGALKMGLNAILVRKENTYQYDKYSMDLDGIWKYII